MSAAATPATARAARAGRALSLVLALSVTAVVVAAPRLLAGSMHEVPHGLLALLLLGMSAAYVHGVGYVPRRRWLRPLAGPLVAWPLIGATAALLAMR